MKANKQKIETGREKKRSPPNVLLDASGIENSGTPRWVRFTKLALSKSSVPVEKSIKRALDGIHKEIILTPIPK